MTALFGGALAFGLWLLIQALVPRPGLALQQRVSRRLVSESSVISTPTKLGVRLRSKLISEKTNLRVLFELPDLLDLLAVSLAAGDSLFKAIERVAPRATGLVASQLQLALHALKLGSSLEAEMTQVAQRLPQRQLAEFCAKVNLALRRGTPLAEMLNEQSASARAEIRNQLLRQAGKNETKMLIPLVFLILPVTILFAIYPSLQMLNLGYF